MNKGQNQNIEVSQPKQSIIYNSGFLCFVSIVILFLHYLLVFTGEMSNFSLVSESSTLYRKILKILTKDKTYSVGLEFAAIAVFVLARRKIKKRQDGSDIPAQVAQVNATLTLLPFLGYIKEFCIWVSENWISFWSYIIQHKQYVVCFVSLTVIFVAGILLFKIKRKNRKIFIFGNTDSFLNNLFLILVILHVTRFAWYYGGICEFIVEKSNNTLDDIIMLSVFLICLIFCAAALINCRRKNYPFPLMMWMIIGMCLLGMVPVFYNVKKVEHFFYEHTIYASIIIVVVTLILILLNLNYEQIRKMLKKNSKSLFLVSLVVVGVLVFLIVLLEKVIDFVGNGNFSEAMQLVMQIFALVAAGLGVIILFIVLVNTIRNLKKTNIKDTEFWKNILDSIHQEQRFFWYGYFAACLLTLAVVLFFFIPEFIRLNEKGNGVTETFSQVIGWIVMLFIFLVAIIFVICQIGVCLMRTFNEVNALNKKEIEHKKQYYGIHGLSAFFTIILSGISWYIYNMVDFSEESALGLAGDVFRYFAFPVIALLWYAILYYILTIVLNMQGKKAKKLYKKIKKKVYIIAEDFVDAIFAPLQLIPNFFSIVFNAMKEDNDENDDEEERVQAVEGEEDSYENTLNCGEGDQEVEKNANDEGEEL